MSADFADPVRNPYSRMAVAKVGAAPLVTVQTEPFRRAYAELGGYLGRDSTPGEGPVIAVVGEYGTGKTHLGIELRLRAERYGARQVRSLLIEATSSGLVHVYRSFLEQLGLDGIRERAQTYHAAAVANALRENNVAAEIVEAVRVGQVDPKAVADTHFLMESAIKQQTRLLLGAVTGHQEICTALLMLTEGGYDQHVWHWLMGEEPDELLSDRGIHGRVDTLDAAVSAMAALTRLHTESATRFVVIVDECERAIPDDPAVLASTTGALRTLILAFAAADAMLVLVGLPDFVHALPADVRQRLPLSVRMTRLTAPDVRDFIEGTHSAVLGRRVLEPFTTETVLHLLAVTNGNPRKIIRFCHELYDLAASGDGAITAEMVNEVVRADDPTRGPHEVGTAVTKAIESQNLPYQRQIHRRADRDSDQDIIVTVDGGKCAVLITGAIVTEADFTELDERMRRLRTGQKISEFVLVVAGAVHEDLAQRIREQLPAEPLGFADQTFAKRFRDQLETVVMRMRETVGQNPWKPVLRLLEQVDNQLLGLYTFLGQLEERHEGLRASVERRLTHLQESTDDLVRGRPAGLLAVNAADVLPPTVDRHFQGVLTALADILSWDGLVAESFAPARDTDSGAAAWLRQRRDLRPVAVAMLARTVVLAFQAALSDWYSSRGDGQDGPWLAALDDLCRAYDSATEYLPLPLIAFLADQGPMRTSRGVPVESLHERLAALPEVVSADIRATLADEDPGP